MKKRYYTSFMALFLALVLFTGTGTPVLAASLNNGMLMEDLQALDGAVVSDAFMVATADNTTVQVKISPELSGTISYSDVYDILVENELNDGDVVVIQEVGEMNNYLPDGNFSENVYLSEGEVMKTSTGVSATAIVNVGDEITPQWKWYDLILYINSSWWYSSEYVAKDVFIASAARGETYTLTKEFESSLSLTLEAGGTYSSVTGKIASTNKISYSVETSHQYTGPSENSTYNSTEYRVKFYAKHCYVTQAVTGDLSGHTSYYNATYVVPTRYLSYSIYRNVT